MLTQDLYTHYMHGIECCDRDRLFLKNDQVALRDTNDDDDGDGDGKTHNVVVVNHDDSVAEAVAAGHNLLDRGTRVSITIRYVPKLAKITLRSILRAV